MNRALIFGLVMFFAMSLENEDIVEDGDYDDLDVFDYDEEDNEDEDLEFEEYEDQYENAHIEL